MQQIIQPLLGLLIILMICVLFSEHRSRIEWRRMAMALALQLILVVLVLKTPVGQAFFALLAKVFAKFHEAYEAGALFVFGDLATQPPIPAKSLALQALPMIIFVSALSSVLYHYGILQKLIHLFSMMLRKLVGMTGPEAMGASANIFLGMAEAPTLIAPYIHKLSRAQLFMIMVGGMATVSGALMMVYAGLVAKILGGMGAATAHLMTASVVSAPAAFLIARLLIPEIEEGLQEVEIEPPQTKGFFDALSQGTLVGIKLTAYVVGMLLVMIALVALIDSGIKYIAVNWMGMKTGSLAAVLGYLLKYPAWFLGIPIEDCEAAGKLLGVKVIANEYLSYLFMSSEKFTSPRTPLILSYAMCGFANLGSVGIMIAAMAGLCPERRAEIAGLGLKAMWGGFMAICMTGIVVAILL